jgi:hypothetical protein
MSVMREVSMADDIGDGLGDDWPGPVLKRMLEISDDVYSGRADAETVEAWNGMRESMESAIDALGDMLAPYPVEDHERLTRALAKKVMAEFNWSKFLPKPH